MNLGVFELFSVRIKWLSITLIESSDMSVTMNAMQDHNAMVTMGFGNNDNATITRKLRQLFSFYAERLFWVLVILWSSSQTPCQLGKLTSGPGPWWAELVATTPISCGKTRWESVTVSLFVFSHLIWQSVTIVKRVGLSTLGSISNCHWPSLDRIYLLNHAPNLSKGSSQKKLSLWVDWVH